MPPAFSSPGLSIRVLGELRVLRGGSPLPLPPSKKTRALLGYLVLTEREHRRDRLCSLFWDVTDDPRGALRWSISKLRALCDEPGAVRIVSDHDAVSFRAHGAAIDWLEVRARAAGDALERLEFDELERLALEFRGELLSGLALEDFDEFQSWCVAQREQARLLHAGVLRALVRRSPSPERALAHARALLRVDSLSQPARALLIDLLGQLGLGAEVEQQYRTGRRLLSELSMSVTDELEEAYRRARRAATERRSVEGRTSLVEAVRALEPPAGEPRETAVVVANPAPAPESVPLVGRERECRELRALLDEAAQGSARVVVLSGDAGVGKSRLLGELALEGSRRGASVLVGQAYEVESGRPYGPWIDALRRIPRAVVGSRLAEELAVLVPEWAPERAARQTEEQLFGAVCDLVAARAHSAPPVIVAFDDAHWLDEPSSRLLHYVARLSRHRPLLVVLSARDGELFDNVAITRALRSLRRDGSLRELALGPLSSDAIAAIAEHLQASAHAARVFAESAGNPLFAIELFRALPGGAQGVSGTLSTLIHDRVQALSEPAVEVLRWASV
ncbi:MAG TPA: AAA family ATPase, partial [Polyangiaceae bacterium]